MQCSTSFSLFIRSFILFLAIVYRGVFLVEEYHLLVQLDRFHNEFYSFSNHRAYVRLTLPDRAKLEPLQNVSTAIAPDDVLRSCRQCDYIETKASKSRYYNCEVCDAFDILSFSEWAIVMEREVVADFLLPYCKNTHTLRWTLCRDVDQESVLRSMYLQPMNMRWSRWNNAIYGFIGFALFIWSCSGWFFYATELVFLVCKNITHSIVQTPTQQQPQLQYFTDQYGGTNPQNDAMTMEGIPTRGTIRRRGNMYSNHLPLSGALGPR